MDEAFNEKIQEQKDYLSELDTPIGDGDHGGNMARGMAAVGMENLEGKQFETSSDVFKLVSMQLLSKVWRCFWSPCMALLLWAWPRLIQIRK